MKKHSEFEISFYASVALKGTNDVQARRIKVLVSAIDETDAIDRVGDALQVLIDGQEARLWP